MGRNFQSGMPPVLFKREYHCFQSPRGCCQRAFQCVNLLLLQGKRFIERLNGPFLEIRFFFETNEPAFGVAHVFFPPVAV